MTAPALAACPRVASRRSCQYASCAALLVQTTTASKPCEPSISFTVAAMRRPFSVVFLRFVPDVGDVMMIDRLPRIGCNRRDYSDRRCAVPMGAAGFDAWTGAVRCDDRCGRLHAMRRGGIGGETSARLALWALRRGRTSEAGGTLSYLYFIETWPSAPRHGTTGCWLGSRNGRGSNRARSPLPTPKWVEAR